MDGTLNNQMDETKVGYQSSHNFTLYGLKQIRCEARSYQNILGMDRHDKNGSVRHMR